MRQYFLFVLTLIFLQSTYHSQEWTEIVHDKNANFYDIQKAFNDYWDLHDKNEKSRGYKAFKRWEYFVEPRVYPSGNLALLSKNAANFEQFLATYTSSTNNQNTKTIGANNLIASSTWSVVGPLGAMTGSAVNGLPRKAGRDNFITFHPTASLTNTYWAGAPAGGLWQTTNNGTSWTTTTDNLPVIGCTDLAVDPSNPSVMYLATGDGYAGDCNSIGVYKSTNGGATWSPTGLTFNVSSYYLIRRLLINPNNTQIVLAATNGGIFRTNNGGTNWTQINSVNTFDMEFKPGDPNTVYAAGTSFYRSTTAGASFTQVTTGIPTSGSNRMAIAVTSNTAGTNYVYVVASNSANSGLLGVYRSTNSGVSFTTTATSPDLLANSCGGTGSGGQGWYDLAIAASPLNADEVVVGGVNHWRSTNGGVNWTNIGCWNSTVANPPYVHADVHDLEYNSAGVLYSANDGGISQYNGTLWIDRTPTGTRNIAQIYRIGLSAITANRWITGHQDNGSNIYNGTTYNASFPGDGLDCFIDWNNNNNLFTETPNGGLVRSTNGGASWSSASSGISGSANWLCPWKQNPQAANVIYAGFNAIWTSTNQGTSWTSLAALTTTAGSVTEFAIAPSNSLVLYVLKNSAVMKTTNGGTSWTNITGTLPVGSAAPTYVAIDPTDPNTAWVTFSGYSAANKVFMTTNGGTSWTNVTSNLPNLPANCIVYEPGTNDRVYVGMDVGVYYKDNSTTNWTLYNAGLPNTVISDLEISPAAPGRLRAATYGRGVYEVDVVACVTNPTVTVNSATICPGASATLAASGASTYAWSNSSTLSAIVVTPSATTIYTVTGSVGACSDVKTATVTVLSAPSLTITPGTPSICAGNTITLVASGATSYSWNIGFPTSGISVSPSLNTVYTVTGTTGACSASRSVTLTVNNAPNVTVSPNQTICPGNCVTLQAAGAGTYTWSTAATTPSIVVCPPINTTYTVIGSNGGCSTTRTVNVSLGSAPTLSVSPNVSVCPGSCATLNVTGATTYTWLPANSNGNSIAVCPSVAAVYTVNGSTGGCAASTTISVGLFNAPSVTVTPGTASLAICAGNSAVLTGSGATNYTWVPGGTGQTISVSPPATTTYTLFGTNGTCTRSVTTTLTVNSVPVLTRTFVASGTSTLIGSGNNYTVFCSGANIVGTASGASTYTWQPGNLSGPSVTLNLLSTTVLTITGANGACSAQNTVNMVFVPGPTIGVSSATTICSGASTALSANGASSYNWLPGNLSGSLVTVSPVATTIYTVTGINGGCSNTRTVSVNVNATPTISFCSTTPTMCQGSTFGFVMCPSGASAYTFAPALSVSGGTYIASPGVTTTYSVIGSNAFCTSNPAVVTLTVYANPTITAIKQPTGAICPGASATLIASGATSYFWSNGSSGASTIVTPSATTIYSVNGISGNGCSSSATLAVNITTGGIAPFISASANSVCQGNSVTLSASGATTYTWSTGSNATGIVVTPTATTTYSLTGSNGACTGNTAITITVTAAPVVVASPNQTICAGGSATLSASGASSYSWSSGANSATAVVSPATTTTYTVTGSSAGCNNTATVSVAVGANLSVFASASPQTICSGNSTSLTASGASSYTWSTGATGASIVVSPATNTVYTVNGQNGACVGSGSVSVTITPPPVITVSASPSATICAGGSATISASGASTYSWSTGATGNAIVVSPSLSTLYFVTGGLPGCSTTNSIAIGVGSGNVTILLNAAPASVCNGGSSTITASGANTYTWSTGAIGNAIVVTPSLTSTYSVTGQSGSCTGNSAITVSVGLSQPLVIAAVPAATICAGRSATLVASGGFASYNWQPIAQSGSAIVVTPAASTIYTLQASGGGCNATATVAISVGSGPVSIVSTTASGCGNFCGGAINAVTTGGAAPYTYSLSGSTCTALPCTNLCQGLYTLKTFDAAGCSSSNILSISSSPNNLIASSSSTNASCSTCANGIISTSVSGGVAPYTYTWSPNIGNSNTSFSATPGCYTITIGDAAGCITSLRACISELTGIAEAESATEPVLFPNPAGKNVNIQVKGGNFTVVIYNELGQLIVTRQSQNDVLTLNTSAYAKGVYHVRIKCGEKEFHKKLILE